jgi:hypothetical protein
MQGQRLTLSFRESLMGEEAVEKDAPQLTDGREASIASWGQACNIAILAWAILKSVLDRVCNRFTSELNVVSSRPVRLLSLSRGKDSQGRWFKCNLIIRKKSGNARKATLTECDVQGKSL